MTLGLSGIGVSRGIAIGRLAMLRQGASNVFELRLDPDQIEPEIRRFRNAVQQASQQLRVIQDAIPESTPKDVAEFIDTHLLMLDDEMLSEAPVTIIRERRCNAEWALKIQRDDLVSVFDQMEDPYLRNRRDDVNYVFARILRGLQRGEGGGETRRLSHRIIVAESLSPADIVYLQHNHIAGFITETGGPLSHSAILARSLKIPAVVGVHTATMLLQDNETVIIDGASGLVLADADHGVIADYRRKLRAQREQRRALLALREAPTVTLDRHHIALHANIELQEEVRSLKQVSAEGVGLYRTEFLYLKRDRPADEEEQLRTYRRVVRALGGKPLTIRTLDLGADKTCSDESAHPQGPNPALGLRAIRRCLKHVDAFKPQLRAILRAAAYGPVRLMFPMLTSISELDAALALLEQVKRELRRERRRFDNRIAVGAMIEVPAAALSASAFAARLDFMSIGTNDLIQYALAIDRLDDEVNYLYDPLHPAVLALISMALEAGKRAGIPVSMCGEMAGDTRYTRLLLGMGLREFSTPPSSLLEVRQVITRSRIDLLRDSCREILSLSDQAEIAQRIRQLNESDQTQQVAEG